MDSLKNTNGGDGGQIEIDRRRAAIRDIKDDLDRARAELVLAIANAIHEAPGDPAAATRAIKRVAQDQDWVAERLWRAFQREFAS